jgi:hypothetical protein
LIKRSSNTCRTTVTPRFSGDRLSSTVLTLAMIALL